MIRLFPEEASSIAREVDRLSIGLLGITGFFVVVVAAPLFYFAIKYRRGSTADRSGPSSGSLALEIGWTLVPLAIALGLFIWGSIIYVRLQAVPRDTLPVHVVAKRWMWKFHHEQGNREINELHVPLGKPISLLMTSQDAIHSFYVPAFRVKQDVVPGKYTATWFVPTKTGRFPLLCAEYCGTDHSRMRGEIIVMDPDDYAQWLTTADGAAEPLAMAGARLFRDLGCSGCHGTGSVVPSPPLEGLFGRQVTLAGGGSVIADENYLRDSILLPASKIVAGYENVMPTYEGQLEEEQILQLVAYIKSIARREPQSVYQGAR